MKAGERETGRERGGGGEGGGQESEGATCESCGWWNEVVGGAFVLAPHRSVHASQKQADDIALTANAFHSRHLLYSLFCRPPPNLHLLYRGTSLIRNRPPTRDHNRALGMALQ